MASYQGSATAPKTVPLLSRMSEKPAIFNLDDFYFERNKDEASTPSGDPTGPWERVTVYTRAWRAYDYNKFGDYDKDGQKIPLAKEISPGGQETPRYIHVGYSLIKPVPIVLEPLNLQDAVIYQLKDVDYASGDEFAGCKFRDILAGINIGPFALLHSAFLIPGNLSRLKRWLSGESFADAFQGAWQLAHRLEELTWGMAKCLQDGLPLQPVATHPLPKFEDMERYLKLRHSGPGTCPGNDVASDKLSITSFATSFEILKRGTVTVSSFKMRLVPVLLYDYPTRLIEILTSFAAKHPKDILHINLMIIACELFHGIRCHPYGMLEDCFKPPRSIKKRLHVPMVDLAGFILYFPHLLRWTETHLLPEYMHPMRFMKHMYTADRHASPLLAMQAYDAKLEEVIPLLRAKRPRVTNIPEDFRITMYPCMMPRSEIPPFGPNPYINPPYPKEIALLGIGSIQIYGLPTYGRTRHVTT
ncbi:hypothetical protein PT974_02177 [Cladobotryum mycophilum]|uniref:Uncharacterized protein n=1 Tax=Cladobotryum mycophilum TaxID=491253 RepID=A0ABR0SXJ3_9HYPO